MNSYDIYTDSKKEESVRQGFSWVNCAFTRAIRLTSASFILLASIVFLNIGLGTASNNESNLATIRINEFCSHMDSEDMRILCVELQADSRNRVHMLFGVIPRLSNKLSKIEQARYHQSVDKCFFPPIYPGDYLQESICVSHVYVDKIIKHLPKELADQMENSARKQVKATVENSPPDPFVDACIKKSKYWSEASICFSESMHSLLMNSIYQKRADDSLKGIQELTDILTGGEKK